jgi:hypothetical protein
MRSRRAIRTDLLSPPALEVIEGDKSNPDTDRRIVLSDEEAEREEDEEEEEEEEEPAGGDGSTP